MMEGNSAGKLLRLAIVLSHPVQYYSPWFRHIALQPECKLKVFYLWDFGVKETRDLAFGNSFVWDIPLLEGYDSEFVPNRSSDPGTHHFKGLDNPAAGATIAAWKPDALLLFGYNYLTHLRLILSPKLRKIPFLFRGDSHNLYRRDSWKQKAATMLRGALFKRFERFLAVGKANADYFRHQGVCEGRIVHVPHCVDNDRFQNAALAAERASASWKRELGIPAEAQVILFAGKFEEKKRPLDLLTAFLSFSRSLPSGLSPVLLFVGSGVLEDEMQKSAGDETGRTVVFAPFQNQTEMPKVYAAGDLLVLPSYGHGETWGLAVNEAMNLGKPAIVSSHVGCGPDLIIPGETGWIFPADDVNALRDTLAEALSEPDRLQQMGRNARQHIANYSYERATAALLKIVKTLPGT